MVIGVGGVGSWAVESLARSGIGRIIMIDPDDLCVTNINRQLPATLDTIGDMKASVLEQRIKAINPYCEVISYFEYLSKENLPELIKMPEDFSMPNQSMLCVTEESKFPQVKPHLYVIDAIDNSGVKAALINHCRIHKHKLVVCGGAGGKFDIIQVKIGDLTEVIQDPLISVIRNQLRSKYGYRERFGDKKFKVPTVYSTEQMKLPEGAQACDLQALNCTNGYGSATVITATFANFAVAELLKMMMNANKN